MESSTFASLPFLGESSKNIKPKVRETFAQKINSLPLARMIHKQYSGEEGSDVWAWMDSLVFPLGTSGVESEHSSSGFYPHTPRLWYIHQYSTSDTPHPGMNFDDRVRSARLVDIMKYSFLVPLGTF